MGAGLRWPLIGNAKIGNPLEILQSGGEAEGIMDKGNGHNFAFHRWA